MSHKIDERKDNIRKIKETIENTQENMELANDMMDSNLDSKQVRTLASQNERRAESINTLQDELKEQIIGKEKKNK